MNILVFSWRDPKHPLAGGAEQVMHEHMKGWVNAGHSVTLFASKMKGLPITEAIDGVTIVRRGYQYWGVQFAGFFFYLKNKEKFDVIVDEFHGLPFFTPLYSRKPKVAVIQEVAREVWLKNPLPFPLNWIVGVIGYLGEPLLFLVYKKTRFIVGSDSTKKELSQYGIAPAQITIVPHGVILHLPKKIPPKNKKHTVLFLGRLSKDKGIEDALQCFSLLYKTNPEMSFEVIGSAETKEYDRRIKNLISRLGIKDVVKFWGFVSQTKKFELLCRAHILINPSIREGWGLVNIEANACKTPVVAYTSPGLVDSVQDGISGVLCTPNNPEQLAKQIQNIFVDNKRLKSLQEGAYKWSKNFSWDNSKKISLKLVNQLAK